MACTVTYSRRTRSHLIEIERYIAEAGSPVNAKAYVHAIVARCDAIAENPHQGTRRDDLMPGLRTFGFRRRVTIAFRIVGDVAQIVGIFYGGRSVEKNL